ncbi:MAG: hypothetical protein DMG63_18320 [Acidobacteria bacterium]|nr:MAG: hypothetical protein DMG63_18320 [Acidobacteriota bacterium]
MLLTMLRQISRRETALAPANRFSHDCYHAELQKARPDWIVENCSALALQSVNDQLKFHLQELASK